MAEYIERELAIEALSRGEGCGNVCRRAIERILAADVAPVRHGRWLDGRCTVCGWKEPYVGTWDGYDAEAWIETPYCPNCGSMMLEG